MGGFMSDEDIDRFNKMREHDNSIPYGKSKMITITTASAIEQIRKVAPRDLVGINFKTSAIYVTSGEVCVRINYQDSLGSLVSKEAVEKLVKLFKVKFNRV